MISSFLVIMWWWEKGEVGGTCKIKKQEKSDVVRKKKR